MSQKKTARVDAAVDQGGPGPLSQLTLSFAPVALGAFGLGLIVALLAMIN